MSTSKPITVQLALVDECGNLFVIPFGGECLRVFVPSWFMLNLSVL